MFASQQGARELGAWCGTLPPSPCSTTKPSSNGRQARGLAWWRFYVAYALRTWHQQVCWGLPNASGEGRLDVSVLMHPPTSTGLFGASLTGLTLLLPFSLAELLSASSSFTAFHQAPCGMTMVPAITSSVTCAGRRSVPKRFDASSKSPVRIPRAAASAGFMEMTCGTRLDTAGTLPHDEWMRAMLWKPNARSGWSQRPCALAGLLGSLASLTLLARAGWRRVVVALSSPTPNSAGPHSGT